MMNILNHFQQLKRMIPNKMPLQLNMINLSDQQRIVQNTLSTKELTISLQLSQQSNLHFLLYM